jgi:hypothetical protein
MNADKKLESQVHVPPQLVDSIRGERLVSAKEAALCLHLPVYLLAQPKERKRLGLPHYRVGKMVRFKVQELMDWLVAQTEEREKALAQAQLRTSEAGEEGTSHA